MNSYFTTAGLLIAVLGASSPAVSAKDSMDRIAPRPVLVVAQLADDLYNQGARGRAEARKQRQARAQGRLESGATARPFDGAGSQQNRGARGRAEARKKWLALAEPAFEAGASAQMVEAADRETDGKTCYGRKRSCSQ